MTSLLEIMGDPSGNETRVPVLMPVALEQTYDYGVRPELELAAGDFVMVPFGNQNRIGIVWDRSIGPESSVAATRLKLVGERLDVPPLPIASMRFAEWVASYTLAPLGMVVRMMMSAKTVFDPVRPRFGVTLSNDAESPDRVTPARRRAMEIASDGMIRSKAGLASEAACTTGVIDGLVKAGYLVDVVIPERRCSRPDPNFARTDFTEQQAAAVYALRAAVDAACYSVTLLDGVTGSGKTEVYFEAVARGLEAERQILIMLPEIALTGQFMNRFERRFGVAPVEWHSALSPNERGRIWRAVANGEARVVVGARSALFLPFVDLGLIVIDEEHDQGFKQDDRVHYQARDMAVVRGHLANVPVVLASATPSVESHVNVRTGKYRHIVLPGRFSGTELPEVSAIDLRIDPPEKGMWLSPRLVSAVSSTLQAGKQALLFLNRRGYAPLTLCRKCGHRVECPQCTAWLVEHRFRKRLCCHHCGFSLPIPEKCPNCSELGSLANCGPGVERIAEEVAHRFPEASTVILSSDLVPGLPEMRKIISEIESGVAQIIIGTQIVAKGHHFPDLATVGIVDGDLGLGQADPRAAERTFQLLYQVTGRAGREAIRGVGLVQTHMPEHPVMQAIISGDRDTFIEREIVQRQMALLPPYGRLAALIVSSRDKHLAEAFAMEIARNAPRAERFQVLGPAEAPIAIVRGRYRWRLLVKAPRELDLQAFLRAWLSILPPAKGDLRLTVDVDPYSFL